MEIINIILLCLPILISIIALIFSIKSYNIKKRENKPCFSIIQNLWTKEPYYELINESESKLDRIPSPSYYLLIPSKVYFVVDNKQAMSVLTLSPLSYELIDEQIVSGSSKNSIVTSKLPPYFTAKKGERDMIKGGLVDESDKLKIYINTYPFLIIISEIEYVYKHKESKEIILSTPLQSIKIDEEMLRNIKEYICDNAKHEVKPQKSDVNIYRLVNEEVKRSYKNGKDNALFFGGKKGGYNNVGSATIN